MKLLILDCATFNCKVYLPFLEKISPEGGLIISDRPSLFNDTAWPVESWPIRFKLSWRLKQLAKEGFTNWLLFGKCQASTLTEISAKLNCNLHWLLSPDIIESECLKAVSWKVKPKVFCVSKGWCDALVNIGWPVENISWLTLPVEASVLADSGSAATLLKRDGLMIGVQADLSENQLVEKLFTVIVSAKAINLNLSVVLIGDGLQKEQLLWLVKKLNLGANVRFVGSRSDLQPWFQDLDLWTTANKQPGVDDLSAAILAAASCLSLLLPSDPTFSDILLPEVNGEKIDWQLTEEAVAILKRWSDNRTTLFNYGQASRHLVKQDLLWSHIQSDWRKILLDN